MWRPGCSTNAEVRIRIFQGELVFVFVYFSPFICFSSTGASHLSRKYLSTDISRIDVVDALLYAELPFLSRFRIPLWQVECGSYPDGARLSI